MFGANFNNLHSLTFCDACSKVIVKDANLKVWHCLHKNCQNVFFCDECVQGNVLSPNGVREGAACDILNDSIEVEN